MCKLTVKQWKLKKIKAAPKLQFERHLKDPTLKREIYGKCKKQIQGRKWKKETRIGAHSANFPVISAIEII